MSSQLFARVPINNGNGKNSKFAWKKPLGEPYFSEALCCGPSILHTMKSDFKDIFRGATKNTLVRPL